MAKATFKISQQEYYNQIVTLQKYLAQLDMKITQYESLRNNMSKFIDGRDDNYEKLRESVETNIKMVRKAREMTDASIKMLQETLQQAEDFGGEMGQVISTAADLAKTTFRGAVEAINLIN